MNDALANIVRLLAAAAVEDFMREAEQQSDPTADESERVYPTARDVTDTGEPRGRRP